MAKKVTEGKKAVASITLRAAAAKLGSKGGKSGGPARAKALTKSQRVAIASKGGHAKARNQGKSGK